MPNRFPVQTSLLAAQKPRLLYTSAITFPEAYEGHLHTHECVEIFFVMAGGGRFRVRGEQMTVQKNDFLIIQPYTEHAECSDEGVTLAYIVIGLENIPLRLSQQSSGFYRGALAEKSTLIRELLTAMVQESASKAAGYEALCDSMLQVILSYLLRFSGQALRAKEADAAPRTYEIRQMMWVKQYLDEHLQRNVSLSDIEPMVNLNRYSIIRSFKQAFGITPMRYLLDARLKEACFYLETSDTSVRQIAELCGFNSANYFSQMFERHKGISPSAYRKRYRDRPGA